uniref:Uncharacterized protein n=1 Tax=Parastrongyloides trichosuri TaxID=131310 RepID=A0A0N4Z6T2_PARTI
MVCLSCVILPIFFALYLRFLQPILLRFIPVKWLQKLEMRMEPTCGVEIPNCNVPSRSDDSLKEEIKSTKKKD